jgi:dihydroorotate dehydrogenase electron transfer subunit
MKIIQLKAPVISSVEAMPETRLIWLDAPEIAGAAKPGQFVMVRCGQETILPRPFSVHRVDGNHLALLFSVVGRGTRWLASKKHVAALEIFGPLGNGFRIDPAAGNLLLVAGGIGIAPLVFLADVATRQGKTVTIIAGARSCDYLAPVSLPQGLFNAGVTGASLHVVCATDDGSEGFKGLATDLVPVYLEGIDQVFACGPAAMYRAMARMPGLKDKDVQLSLEIMMGCGAGACYGCTIETKMGLKQVCRDGPVFNLNEVGWGE